MEKIYLIRHGRTEANEKWLYCGSTDVGLSQSGAQELHKIHYAMPENCKYITSGMKRTEETLNILFGDVVHEIDQRFREVNFGIFEMRSYEELKTEEEYQIWISSDNEKNIPPKGESGEQMKERVMKAFEELKEQTQDIVLISHGGVIAAIMEHLFPEEGKNRYLWQPKPGHGYVIFEGGYREIETNEDII